MIVVDASAILEVLLVTQAGQAVIERLFATGQTLHAPHLLDLEIAQVLRRYSIRGDLGERRSQQALDDLAFLGIRRYPHVPFVDRVWELRHSVTAYDAAYVALAEALDSPLLTADQRLAGASGHRARIELLGA